MPFGLGPWELGIILVIVLVIFGAGKVPEIGKALGKGIREFRSSASSDDVEKDKSAEKAEEPEAAGKKN